jgi:hypothetical protein
MKTRHLLTATTAAVAALLFTAVPAHASLIGDSLNVTVTHTGVAGGLVGAANVTHTYAGLPSTFTHPMFGSFLIATPANAPGFDNAVLVDFSMFNYMGFSNSTGTIVIAGIAEDVAPGSVAIFAGVVGAGVNIASGASDAGSMLTASWSSNSIFTPGAAPDAMVVAWDSAPVPAPGALALLGMAGVVAGSRRRRAMKA